MPCSTASRCARATTPACRCCRPTTRICRRTRRSTRPTARSASAKSTSWVRSSGACVEHQLRDFRLAGVGLDPRAQAALQERAAGAHAAAVEIRRERARCDQRLEPSRHRRGGARRPQRVDHRTGAPPRARRASRGLGADPRPADLCGGGHGCRIARAAPRVLRGLVDARLGSGPQRARAGTTRR